MRNIVDIDILWLALAIRVVLRMGGVGFVATASYSENGKLQNDHRPEIKQ